MVSRDQKIVELLGRHPDVTYEEVGGLVGITRQRVQDITKKAGLRRQPGRHYRRNITIEQVLELYHRDLLLKDMGPALGCSGGVITRRLREAGIGKRECYSRGAKLAKRRKHG